MYLIFDIGGTHTRVAYSNNGKTISGKTSFPTPNTFSEGIKQIRTSVKDFSIAGKVSYAVGGVAGPLDQTKAKLVNAPHLRNWAGKPLKKELQKIAKCGVTLENDTALVGLGEATHGAGKGYRIVSYITISTGVNGVRVVDGIIDKTAMGFEIGHQIVNPGHPTRKTIEKLISGTAIKRIYKKQPSEIESAKIWKEISDWVAIGIANTAVYWSPHIIVLGGGVSNELKHYFPYIKSRLKKELTIFKKHPVIKKSTLKSTGGLYGGLAIIQNQKRK
jgi:glucokinase